MGHPRGGKRLVRGADEAALLDRARTLLPSGVRNSTGSPDYAMVVREARGARLTDWSGNEYVDYLLGSGPMLLGHAHPAVTAAVRDALASGSNPFLVSEPAIRLAEEIVRAVPCAEQVSFHSSGSEATFFAMRLARAFRGREKILKFEGAFHGMHDYALMSTQWTRRPVDFPTAVPNSAGIPRALEANVLIAPFNDIDTTAAIVERHRDELAGVIVEPLQRTIPPRGGFLSDLRDLTRRHGIPLIFDEIVTGFRLAYGGAQEYYGVVPDLCALGKSMSGGHPITAVCGSEEIFLHADVIRNRGRGHVLLTGTFSGNPISATAALATLGVLRKQGSYERLFATGRRLMESLQSLLDEASIAARVTGEPPAFEVWFADREMTDFRSMLAADTATHGRFTELLLEHGVLKAHEKFFVSLAHNEEDVQKTVAAFAAAVAELKEWSEKRAARQGA
jgi:glutamate-1-semialdehyde 2,1-aminomutase